MTPVRTGPVVVLGDALLDIDLVGKVARLAPDAPVPVLDDATEHLRPGGAGLSAQLLAADGHDVVLITALATLGAFLYNLSASLLGGIEVTLAEED